MLYRVLGDLEVGPDGLPLPLPAGSALPILVAFLMKPNRRLTVRELTTAAWGHVDVHPGQLHKRVSYVRGLLKKIGQSNELVNHRGQGYELRIEPADLDSLRFTTLVKNAEGFRNAQQHDEEIENLRSALRLWRGQHALANVENLSWSKEVDDLEQRRRRAAARLFSLELARHNYESVLEELARLTSYYPTDRQLLEQRMVALYRCGLSAEAVDAFQRHVNALERETGAAPDPTVRRLAYAVSNGDEYVVATVEAAFSGEPGVRESISVPRQLPPAPAHFVGREDLVEELRWVLTPRSGSDRPAPKVLVVSGLGGSGKTTLMRHVAHLVADYYPDGQLHVELQGSTVPLADTEALGGLLRALGLARIPDTREDRLAAYRTMTATRRTLLLLDDAIDEAQIRDLIPANPGSAVLVTARRRLPDLDDAHPIALDPTLPQVTAAELFRQFAAGSSVDVATDPAGVERVVELCARLPLALRLAASLQVEGNLTPTELADQLALHGLDGLTYGPRSVSRAIGASIDRLTDEAKHLFLGLALTELPEFARWTAAAILDGTGADPGLTLSQLATYYLIEPVGSGRRYRFHDLTRAYARILAARDYTDPHHRRKLVERAYGALLTLARRAHRHLVNGDYEVVHSQYPDWPGPTTLLGEVDADASGWFERERMNIRAAVGHSAAYGLSSLCWDLAMSAQKFYAYRGYVDDWHATANTALDVCRRTGDRRGAAVTLVSLGQPALVASRRTSSVSDPADLQEAIDILVDLDDQHGLAIAEQTLANALRRRGHVTRALALFEKALDRFTASDDAIGRWHTLRFIGQTHLDFGAANEALDTLALALAATDGLKGPQPVAETMYWIGQAYLVAGDLPAAERAFQDLAELGFYGGPGEACALHGLGEVALRSGDLETAASYVARAAHIAQAADDTTVDGLISITIADLRRAQGDSEAQVAALEHAIACFEVGDAAYDQLRAHRALSQAEYARGNRDRGRAAWSRAEIIYAELGLPPEDRAHLNLTAPLDRR